MLNIQSPELGCSGPFWVNSLWCLSIKVRAKECEIVVLVLENNFRGRNKARELSGPILFKHFRPKSHFFPPIPKC